LTEVGRREKPPSVEWNVLRADLVPKACAAGSGFADGEPVRCATFAALRM
jgi:hypothetical protein